MKKTKLVLVKYLLILVLIVPMASCSEDDPVETPKRTEKEITEFSIPSLELTGEINPDAHTIALVVTPDFNQSLLENVVPDIKYTGVSIEPAVTEPQNFTRNVTYKVTAEDGSSQNYTVSLTVSEFVSSGFAKVTEVWAKTDWAALNFSPGGIENTLAYKDGKVVASRSGIILDANTGDPTGARLNVSGASGKFHPTDPTRDYPFSLTNDDAGNVIGVALGAWTVSFLPVYKWTSLDSPPVLVYELTSDTWAGGNTGNIKPFGRKIGVTGDINGNGYIMQYCQNNQGVGGDKQQYIWKVTGGVVNPASYTAIMVECDPIDNTYYQTLIPMTDTYTDIYPYYLAATGSTTGVPPSEVSYKPNVSQNRVIIEGFQVEGEDQIFSSKWGAYVYHAKKFDFNGVKYIAVLSVSSPQTPGDQNSCVYYLAILDTRTNTVTKVITIPRGDKVNINGSVSVTNGLEETLPTGEKRIRLYSLFTDLGVFCHELTNKP
ncbi:MAG: DUF5018 domain-containing protein [Prevotellaceae bacterium]|jgi:hypothetical protein|nr:DUF5018 domain-containing protein [Prevotellaceae bacterium]